MIIDTVVKSLSHITRLLTHPHTQHIHKSTHVHKHSHPHIHTHIHIYVHTHTHTNVNALFMYTYTHVPTHTEACSIKLQYNNSMYTYIHIHTYKICDWACKNQPCEHKKSLIFSSLYHHNLQTIYTNTIKPLPLLHNLMGFLMKLMEMGYHIQR